MIISSDIKNIIQSFPEGRVFSISDFAIDPQYDMALAKLLSRMSAKGEIQKIGLTCKVPCLSYPKIL